MVAALGLYCDLLEQPGVLSAEYRHFALELRLVGGASSRLLDKLASAQYSSQRLLSAAGHFSSAASDSVAEPLAESSQSFPRRGKRLLQSSNDAVESLAGELLANQNLLSALVGPAITLGISQSGGAHPVAITRDDLTRVLVNLAKNAAEAMPAGGHLQIDLEHTPGSLSLSFTDNGPGIPESALESIFAPGYTTSVSLDRDSEPSPGQVSAPRADSDPCRWPVRHRGLGLSIVRSIVSAAGGSVWAANRICGGAVGDGGRAACTAPRDAERGADRRQTMRGAVITVEFPVKEPLNSG
jgi:signal transduction histidine kinase